MVTISLARKFFYQIKNECEAKYSFLNKVVYLSDELRIILEK